MVEKGKREKTAMGTRVEADWRERGTDWGEVEAAMVKAVVDDPVRLVITALVEQSVAA